MEPCGYMKDYAARLRRTIQEGVQAPDYDHPLAGLHIVVDAGNGAGGFYAWDVLEPLGADISGSQFLEPDGMFPNHIPNPENETAMASICQAGKGLWRGPGRHLRHRRGPGRRRGQPGGGNQPQPPGGPGLRHRLGGQPRRHRGDGLHHLRRAEEYIETTLGGQHHRFKRGYKNVINEALRLNQEGVNCPLAIETSGHAAMRENHFLDDGAYLVTKILIKMASLRKEGKDLTSLLAPLREPVEAAEVRLPITEENFRACGEALIAALEAYAQEQNWAIAPDNREGIRVSFPKGEGEGWFLLRLSVHDPILPINLESDCAGGVAVIGKKLLQFLEAHKEGVDLSPLENFLNAPPSLTKPQRAPSGALFYRRPLSTRNSVWRKGSSPSQERPGCIAVRPHTAKGTRSNPPGETVASPAWPGHSSTDWAHTRPTWTVPPAGSR